MNMADLPLRYQLQASAQLHAHKPPPLHPLPPSQPEPAHADALGRPAPGEAQDAPRIVVRFVCHRIRPLDPDNSAGSVKFLLDGLRYAGLIPGDEPWRIRLETEQVRVRRKADQRTEVTIFYP